MFVATPLEGFGPDLAGADPHAAVDRDGPDLAVADLPGPPRLGDHVHDLVDITGVDEDLDLDLGHEAELVLGSSERLALAALAAVPLNLRDRHSDDPGGPQGVFDFFQLVRLDDRSDEVNHTDSLSIETGFLVITSLLTGVLEAPSWVL